MWTDDAVADFNRHEAEKQKWLKSRPICCVCEEHIQSEKAIFYNDKWCCTEWSCETEFWGNIREDFLEDV